MESPFHNQIEAYIRRELTPEAHSAFEDVLRADAALRDAVQAHRALMDQLELLRLRRKVAGNLSPAVGRRRVPHWLILFIGTALVAWSIFLIRTASKKQDPPPIPETPAYDQPHGTPIQELESLPEKPRDPQKPTPKQQPVVADPRFAAALRTLESMDDTPMGSGDADAKKRAHLIRITRLLLDHEPEQALLLIGALPDDADSDYTEDLEWLKAITLLGTQPESGLKVLQHIAASPHHAYRKKAILLLKPIQ